MRNLGNGGGQPTPTPSHHSADAFRAGANSPAPQWMLPSTRLAQEPRSGSVTPNLSFNSQLAPNPGQAASFNAGSFGSSDDSRIDPSLLPPPSNQLAATGNRTPPKNIGEAATVEDGTVARIKEHFLTNAMRGYGRWREVLVDFLNIITKGRFAVTMAAGRSLSAEEIIYGNKWTQLVTAYPCIEKEIEKRGEVEVAKLLNAGRQSARSEDVVRVKEIMDRLCNFETLLPAKHKRGINNLDCLSLLAPFGTFDNGVDKNAVLDAYKKKKRVLKPGHYSPLLYKDGVMNPAEKTKGFLLGEIPIKIGIAISFGKAVMGEDDPDEPAGDRPARGIAVKHGQMEVTPEFIGYCCVLAHFVLSSATSLTLNTKGLGNPKFTYGAYYNSIIQLYHVQTDVWKSKLLNEWNRRVYGEPDYETDSILTNEQMFPPDSLAYQMYEEAQAAREEEARAAREEEAEYDD